MKSIIIIFNITPFPYFLQNDLYIFLENTYTLTFLKLKVDHIIRVYDGGRKGQSWKVQPEKYFCFKKYIDGCIV